ncbi:MAG: class I SAM-dependent DNA methyltransferase, partial [Deltaproteobacteria bacterium]|nr:class I SAM-dependent DNA methyltransferase [Deltaproteobacteria bacterium]
VFMARLLFCFFAEDTGIFPKDNMMTDAIQSTTQSDGRDLPDFFEALFAVLDTPLEAPERKSLPASLLDFPYIDNGLFHERAAIPRMNFKSRRMLISCGRLLWADISPVIFGAMFQTVMDQQERREYGEHFTSEENIFKVIRPLFLDDLQAEFEKISGMKTGKPRDKALREFQVKLGSLGFLDPACGSGNFLIVAFRELRELELKVLLELKNNSSAGLWLDGIIESRVTVGQFHGIEINEFPVDIARVSMMLMEHTMNRKMSEALGNTVKSRSFGHAANIVCANALRIPWEDVVAPEKLHYILGNPPFVGSSYMSADQKSDALFVFERRKKTAALDYVAAWYEKASIYMQKNKLISAAFVSTNSICQGEQVAPLWGELQKRGVTILFAHQTFKWNNEAKNRAAVYCVIVGFSYTDKANKRLFVYPSITSSPYELVCKAINAYLVASSNVIISSEKVALSAPFPMYRVNQPTDGGNLIIETAEIDEFIQKEPLAEPYIKKLIGSEEFLHSKERFCLWLVNAPQEILALPVIASRIEKVKKFRLASPKKATRFSANSPQVFQDVRFKVQPKSSLVIPSVSSERRKYIPMGMIDENTIATNLVHIVPNATYYEFGILTSAMHMAWMRTVCGRLKSDYRYSRDLCYNTFPWPAVTEQQKKSLEELAENVLLAREMHPDMTLADMYDPNKMPEDLREAHAALDLAVDALYRKKPFENDEERLQLLFQLYETLIGKTSADKADSVEEKEEDDA